MKLERYARQMAFGHVGRAGQEKLLRSKVAIIGMGALGTVLANGLCRAGVGHIRLVDRDYVELNNLQRQLLYTEQDAGQSLPKAVAACQHLENINSEIQLEPVIADANPNNIDQLLGGVHLALDATDNWETRLLLNEACHALGIPWIYCGVLGAEGTTMNILPGGPCLRCFVAGPGAAPSHSCATFGVLNMITGAIANLQAAEALKILIGSSAVRRGLLTMDVWGNYTATVRLEKNPDCPVCGRGEYAYYGRAPGTCTTSLCGSNAIQVTPAEAPALDFAQLAQRLARAGTVRQTPFMLFFSDGKYEFTLFRDGRAMIQNAKDEAHAKSLYVEYFG
jgi:adenylyltransferase/sulfurtransferase